MSFHKRNPKLLLLAILVISSIASVHDRLVMQTDWQAPNKRIVVVDLNNPARDKWLTIVPEGRDAIAGFSLVGGKLFVSYLHNVTTQIKIFSLDGKALGEVSLPALHFKRER